MAEEEIFKTTRSLEINDFKYSYKDQLINDFLLIDVFIETIAKIIIKIKKSELLKYNKENNNQINYIITSKEKEPTCNKEKIQKSEKIDREESKKKNL